MSTERDPLMATPISSNAKADVRISNNEVLKPRPPMLNVGDLLPEVGSVVVSEKQSFTIEEIVGKGGYGVVFRVSSSDGNKQMALKAELFSKSILRNELIVLKNAAVLRCQHICKLYDFGRIDKQFKYIVMTLLGTDLYKLRKDRVSQTFTLGTTVQAAIQTMKATEELHFCGYVSRDIKPSNFAIGTSSDHLVRKIFIFDFGLSKQYIKDGRLLPSKGKSGWRGTSRYASLKAHSKMDQGRRDDVESWLYMVIEFCNGSLPWRFTRGREEVAQMKLSSRTSLRTKLFSHCPQEFDGFLTLIDALKFETKPPYEELYTTLERILLGQGIQADIPLDWELPSEMISTSSNSSGGKADPTTQMMMLEWPKRQQAARLTSVDAQQCQGGQSVTTDAQKGLSVPQTATDGLNRQNPLQLVTPALDPTSR